MKLTYDVKNFFFDRRAVQDRIGIAEARNLSKIGAFLRRRARSLLRRRKASAAAGSPPSVHSTSTYATLKNILFAYNQSMHAVVTGPIKIDTPANKRQGGEPVPSVQEHGGTVQIQEERYVGSKGRWFQRDMGNFRRSSKEVRSRHIVVRPHPFMGAALAMEVASGSIRDIWRGSISR